MKRSEYRAWLNSELVKLDRETLADVQVALQAATEAMAELQDADTVATGAREEARSLAEYIRFRAQNMTNLAGVS